MDELIIKLAFFETEQMAVKERAVTSKAQIISQSDVRLVVAKLKKLQ